MRKLTEQFLMLVALPVAAERGVRSLIDQNSHPSLPVRSAGCSHFLVHAGRCADCEWRFLHSDSKRADAV